MTGASRLLVLLGTVATILSGCSRKDSSAPVIETPTSPSPPTSPQSCSYLVTPVEFSIPRDRWTADVSIDTAAGCGWTAASTASWLRVRSASGTGPGTLTYEADFNSQTAYSDRRLGVIEIRWPAPTAGQNVRVTQWGDCRITASPAKDGLPAGATYAGSGTVDSGILTVRPAGGRAHFWVLSDPFMGCAWTAESDDSWILWQWPRPHQINSGDGDLVFTVPAKGRAETRRAVVTLGGRFRLTIVQ